MMAGMGMKRALKALALVAAVVLAMLVGAFAWRASHLVVAEGEPASGAPALSEWAYFGEFWEEADFLTASYAEMAADGSVDYYRLKDGWGPNPRQAFRSIPLLDGTAEVGADGAWNLTLVDCATGEVSYWALSREAAERFKVAEGDAVGLEGIGVFPLGGRWAAFAHAPVRTVAPHLSSYDTSGPWDEVGAYAAAIGDTESKLADWRSGDASAIGGLVAKCRPLAEGGKTYSALVVVQTAEGELLESLCDAYGEEAVAEWRSMPPMSEGEGFEDFLRRRWPDLDYAGDILGACASTGRVDYGWVD